jgi:DNA-binding NarL/FixJ family response regulator
MDSASMPYRLTATMAPLPLRGGPLGHGTVHSIESARRRFRRQAPRDVIRVLVAGGHAITRAGLRLLLEGDAGLQVVGEAASGRDGARLARSTDADVALLDAGRFDVDLAAATRSLAPHLAVLLLTECEPDERLLGAIRAGATGVLAKDSHPAELASAVRTLAHGGALLPPRTARRLITELVNTTSTTPV